MREATFDAVWATFEWLVVAVGSVAFTGAGIRFEEAGRAALAAANLGSAALDFAVAAALLVLGVYLLGYRQVLPRTLAPFTRDADAD